MWPGRHSRDGIDMTVTLPVRQGQSNVRSVDRRIAVRNSSFPGRPAEEGDVRSGTTTARRGTDHDRRWSAQAANEQRRSLLSFLRSNGVGHPGCPSNCHTSKVWSTTQRRNVYHRSLRRKLPMMMMKSSLLLLGRSTRFGCVGWLLLLLAVVVVCTTMAEYASTATSSSSFVQNRRRLGAVAGDTTTTTTTTLVTTTTTSTREQQPLSHANRRSLVWSEKETICSDELFAQVRGPSATYCYQKDIVWDPDAILTGLEITTDFHIQHRFDNGDPYTTVDQRYTHFGYYNNAAGAQRCYGFGGCSVGLHRVPGQYFYDCGNVYCGPNAVRACDGTYYEVPCPTGTAPSVPAIPLLRHINCAKLRDEEAARNPALLATCTACTDHDMLNITSVSCAPRCLTCDDAANCVATIEESIIFTEWWRQDLQCISTVLSGQQEQPQTACIRKVSPAQLFFVGANSGFFSCFASLNDAPCATCTVCNVPQRGFGLFGRADILYQADCTNVDADSYYDECTNTFSGAFAPFARLWDPANNVTNCPSQGTTALPPFVPMAPVGPPLDTSMMMIMDGAAAVPDVPAPASPGTVAVAAPVVGGPPASPNTAILNPPRPVSSSSSGKTRVSKVVVMTMVAMFYLVGATIVW
jgi:hypothetical protein